MMKHLFDWWRDNSTDVFAWIGRIYIIRTVIVVIARAMLRRRDAEFYTRRNRKPPRELFDESDLYNHPSGKGY